MFNGNDQMMLGSLAFFQAFRSYAQEQQSRAYRAEEGNESFASASVSRSWSERLGLQSGEKLTPAYRISTAGAR